MWPLTILDYELYEAAYPDGPKMDLQFLADYVCEESAEMEDANDFASEASSEFISNPEMGPQQVDNEDNASEQQFGPSVPELLEYLESYVNRSSEDEDEVIPSPCMCSSCMPATRLNTLAFDAPDDFINSNEDLPGSPFKRPSNPSPRERFSHPSPFGDIQEYIDSEDDEPPSPIKRTSDPEADFCEIEIEREEQDVRTRVRLPVATPLQSALESHEYHGLSDIEEQDEEDERDIESVSAPDANESSAQDAPTSSESRYHPRLSPDSWTGLYLGPWGRDFYLDGQGTMGVRNVWESESGMYHGALQQCQWGWYDDHADAPACFAGIELKVTTPEGEERWLDEPSEYQPGYGYLCLYEEGNYAHSCGGERCTEFFDGFSWELFPRNQDFGLELELELEKEWRQNDTEGEVKEFGRRLLDAVPEEDEDLSEVEMEDLGTLDRLADAVLRKCASRAKNAVDGEHASEKAEEKVGENEEKAGENGAKELPMWMRDPFYVSKGTSWADLAEEDEEW
ncbi:hypothetical protein N657DRAFT_687069 [Parathielavia appendiculata]|uniref:Uncharacterized protein n=1 Tax=Parathielavia appendiculata TaxID=2587402 RepID=A0AAN6Z8L1_9PEZI|nr:hypothetical protein N657DRAFT_687069 [Parathielavia appendiculata]